MPRPLLLLLAALWLSACSQEPAPADPADAPAVAAEEDTRAAAQRPARGERAPRERMERLRQGRAAGGDWWTDEEVAQTLGLTAGQREAIGREVERLRADAARAGAAARDALAQYRGALARGDLAAARTAAGEHAGHLREQALHRYLLPLAALEPLQPAQRTLLVEQHPALLAGLVRSARPEPSPRRRREGADRQDAD